jgi:hypothetical protein
MSILKSKIANALKKRQLHERAARCLQTPRVQNHAPRVQRNLRTSTIKPKLLKTVTSKGSTSCKNVMKNYSKAFTAFALSPIALPYLTPILQKYQVDSQAFIEFIELRKGAANCIKGLRDLLLLVVDTDSAETALMKQVFQEISVVFLKSFSVNWIFHGKVMDKTAHLSYRHKILRRIQNPSNFAGLEDFP